MISEPIYSLREGDVFTALETSPAGLSDEEAESRRNLYGPNIISEQEENPLWHRMLGSVSILQGLVLIAAAGAAIVLGNPLLSLFILAILVLNTSLTFYREYRTGRALEKLRQILPSFSHVMRGGEDVRIPTSEIVPGDILVLEEGGHIPADARVVEGY